MFVLQDCWEVWKEPEESNTNGTYVALNLNVGRFDKNNASLHVQVEACKVSQYPFSATQPIQELDWEVKQLFFHWKIIL